MVKQVVGNSLKGYEDDFNGNTFDSLKEDASGPISPCNIAKEGIDWEVLGGSFSIDLGSAKNLLQPSGFYASMWTRTTFLLY